jgi:hypothetical protein
MAAADLRLRQAPLIQNILFERGPFGAERSAIDGMIGVALDMHDLRGHVLGSVADGVNNHAAAYGAVRTSGARLIGSRDLEGAELRKRGLQVKSEDSGCSSTNGR